MTKITADHLGRGAFVYIRQSTADQLLHNPESRRRQYGLADRAQQLGWTTVEVIDDDLGRSGGGINRPGFERLLAAICEGRVGAVLAIEASRLARNGRDWHTLIEFCGLVGTIIVDEDGIYDPRHPNDRLLLGMKGTMSELELSLFRQRSHEALKQKARRGALFLGVAAGYVRIGRDRIEKDRISGCRTPSGWSLPSSPSCKACDRCMCGCATRALHCLLQAIARRTGTALFGGCRSTTPCTMS
ncbi:recombinase family protein [Bradyrhizobium sp. RDI18]|uniref:recombinase family protein n=1 Tax=Bradyrhizobium sp. RDI18 TaxID=3367400 RepID=UPI0037191E49